MIGLQLVLPPEGQRLRVGMDQPIEAEWCEFVGVVGRPGADQGGDKSRLAGKARTGDQQSPSSQSDHAGVDEDPLGGVYRDARLHHAGKGFEREVKRDTLEQIDAAQIDPIRPAIVAENPQSVLDIRVRAPLPAWWQDFGDSVACLPAVRRHPHPDAEGFEGDDAPAVVRYRLTHDRGLENCAFWTRTRLASIALAMDSLVLGVQLFLAAVFATAGVGKLLDQAGSRRALAGFGVPERAAPAAGLLLPLAELATAAALLANPSARWGAVAALALLLAFILGIARALSRGEAPDCHCFGQLHSAPAGRGTLARNAALAALAAVVVIHGPGPPIDAWVDARSTTELVAVGAGLLAAVLAGVCLRLWLDNRRLRADLAHEQETSALFPPGLPVGASAPSFALPNLRGETVSLDSLLQRGRPVALIFASPSCGPCATLLPELGRWQVTLANHLTIAVLSFGNVAENRQLEQQYGLADVLLQDGLEVMEEYRLQSTPSVAVVASDGRIASVAAVGAPAVEPLLRLTLRGATTIRGEGPAGANGARSAQQPASS
jgi:thiol-disulfide isomerase/thioredoxin/uncharacterized membrane protein YphA (DoxX/SURF4 family)